MTSIGTAAPAIHQDRAVYVQRLAEMSGGRLNAGELTKTLEDNDRIKLQGYQTIQDVYDGKGINVNGTTDEMAANALAQAREVRSQHYSYVSGPVSINAMNVDSAVKAQSTLTGGDLKDLSIYADYLRGEVDAASKVRSDVTFTGSWGANRTTNDVNEYISWLYQAAQGSSSTSEQVSA